MTKGAFFTKTLAILKDEVSFDNFLNMYFLVFSFEISIYALEVTKKCQGRHTFFTRISYGLSSISVMETIKEWV